MLDGGLTLPDPARSEAVFYSDCDAQTSRWGKSMLRAQSGAAFDERVPKPAWRNIPSTYVVCAKDMAMPPDVQRNVFAPRATEAIELQADHSPFLSQPAAVAELLAARSR
jgi:pimeloyl-ACP methyl ester carboxylesterase